MLQINEVSWIKPRGNSLTVMPHFITPFEVIADEMKIDQKVAYRNVNRHIEEITIAGLALAILSILLTVFLSIRSRKMKLYNNRIKADAGKRGGASR